MDARDQSRPGIRGGTTPAAGTGAAEEGSASPAARDVAGRPPGEFERVARSLDHDLARLDAGDMVVRDMRVPTVAEARRLLCRADEASRAARLPSFFQPQIEIRRRLGQGMHDRGEAAIWAGGPEVDGDRRGLSRHLPLRVRTCSIRSKHIGAGEVWDASVRGIDWGVDDLEELYVSLNVETLILEPGAALIVRGNVLSLLCQHLVVRGDAPPSNRPYHIGILPTPFSVDLRHGPQHGMRGVDGAKGTPGAPGMAPGMRAGLLGMMPVETGDPRSRCGAPGTRGASGGAGGHGRNGGMCKLAEITVRDLTGSLVVFARPGDGGQGGDGGEGGIGGHGGAGALGVVTPLVTVAPGSGGDGGDGGHGGDGGDAGSGGIASNVYVDVPEDAASRVACVSHASRPGIGGLAGKGEKGGSGGAGGSGEGARCGAPGRDGRPGVSGRDGRARPGATIFLNGRVTAVGEVQKEK